MAERDGRLIVRILDSRGEPLEGTANIHLSHQRLSDDRKLSDVDTSRPIVIEDLHRTPQGLYLIRVSPAGLKPSAQFFNVRPSGDTELTIVFEIHPDDNEPDLPPGDPDGLPLTAEDLASVFRGQRITIHPNTIRLKHPKFPERETVTEFAGWEAYTPPDPVMPANHALLGGLPVRIAEDRFALPDLGDVIRSGFEIRPWTPADWWIWDTFLPPVSPCAAVPSKSGRVEVPISARARMGKVSHDCARVFTVNNVGTGCVVNVLTESVDANFSITPKPDPDPPYPAGLGTPIVHPFTKGGINHKYKRLYVPASFYSTARVAENGGFYVAVIDVDPSSPTYLDTIGWIDCGWIPEEVSFTADNETGVIANYMQGTATIFNAADNSILAAELDGFDGAGAGGGGAFARSVRCGNVPGIGERAFLTLTTSTPKPGLAVFDLESPGFPRTNVDIPTGAVGVALTPDRRRALALGGNKLVVVKVDQAVPAIERTIDLPVGGGKIYFGGIAVRPSGDLAFLATGGATAGAGGTSLVQVNYMSGTVIEVPSGLAAQTWNIDIRSLGSERKPHLFVTSGSGMLTIIPC